MGRVDEIGRERCARGGRIVSWIGPVGDEVGVGEIVGDEDHLRPGLDVNSVPSTVKVDVRCSERRGR